jgi:hypothetical protein
MTDLHDTDILAWSEQQATLLRRRAAGELVNDAGLDWRNIAEEIESVGSEQLHVVESLLLQALVHMLKATSWPTSDMVPHWLSEERRFRADAANRCSPSMRRRIDLPALYRKALWVLPNRVDGYMPSALTRVCPVTLDDLLSES